MSPRNGVWHATASGANNRSNTLRLRRRNARQQCAETNHPHSNAIPTYGLSPGAQPTAAQSATDGFTTQLRASGKIYAYV